MKIEKQLGNRQLKPQPSGVGGADFIPQGLKLNLILKVKPAKHQVNASIIDSSLIM